MKTLKEQNETLKKYFNLTIEIPKELPPQHTEAEGMFLIPKWEKIGKTYNQAVQKVLEALKKDRPCYDYRDGNWGESYLRQSTPRVIPEIVSAQLGRKYKGKSVEEARNFFNGRTDEVGMGIYEVGIIVLTNPEVLKSFDDLWIDCAGDEYSYGADGQFSESPYFEFHDDRPGFDTVDVGYASGYYGSGSVFAPQSSLEPRILESFESLSLESAIKVCKEAGLTITKTY